MVVEGGLIGEDFRDQKAPGNLIAGRDGEGQAAGFCPRQVYVQRQGGSDRRQPVFRHVDMAVEKDLRYDSTP